MGPNHFELRDICSPCGSANPLANIWKMCLQEVNTPPEIIVCFAQCGYGAHVLRVDCKTALGPWITFASGNPLERAVRYLGATDEQIEAHRNPMRKCGQGSSHIRLLPK